MLNTIGIGQLVHGENLNHVLLIPNVTTLALGSRPRQGFAKVWAKKEAQESHLMLPKMYESLRERTLTFPSELSLWELES